MVNIRRLPRPVAEAWEWQRLGACRGSDSTVFFQPDGERGTSRDRREARAKALCGRCPVRPECAAHALATREPYGVWGGFTEGERLRLLAAGWEDLADRRRTRVDIARLAARLHPRAPVALPRPRAPRPERAADAGRRFAESRG
ncbi:MAG: WhiB family transcriptional regulator [Micromonosporaceae bacterium]|uniref:Transcriptional regulator WhiB n=1 Tax=Thermocrispum agreste TaxID=37925 RepID=A0A2W4ISP5_9PSEU|nr:MAG: transcriptional regulator [Thermocrispum agreste]